MQDLSSYMLAAATLAQRLPSDEYGDFGKGLRDVCKALQGIRWHLLFAMGTKRLSRLTLTSPDPEHPQLFMAAREVLGEENTSNDGYVVSDCFARAFNMPDPPEQLDDHNGKKLCVNTGLQFNHSDLLAKLYEISPGEDDPVELAKLASKIIKGYYGSATLDVDAFVAAGNRYAAAGKKCLEEAIALADGLITEPSSVKQLTEEQLRCFKLLSLYGNYFEMAGPKLEQAQVKPKLVKERLSRMLDDWTEHFAGATDEVHKALRQIEEYDAVTPLTQYFERLRRRAEFEHLYTMSIQEPTALINWVLDNSPEPPPAMPAIIESARKRIVLAIGKLPEATLLDLVSDDADTRSAVIRYVYYAVSDAEDRLLTSVRRAYNRALYAAVGCSTYLRRSASAGLANAVQSVLCRSSRQQQPGLVSKHYPEFISEALYTAVSKYMDLSPQQEQRLEDIADRVADRL